jgi:prepilin-type N-terminal cleavage/methylation domain-containing protein
MKPYHGRSRASFTLIELLTVIAIIAILAALTLAAASSVSKSAARSRARSEIAAMSAAMESYKEDNGTFPMPSTATGFSSTNAYASTIPSLSGGSYQLSSAFLFYTLTGQQYFGVPAPTGTKIYMTFKSSQLGNDTSSAAGNPIYIKDPFGNSYGYFGGTVGDTSPNDAPVNGLNQFDLWSTGGDVSGTPTGMNSWISNWGLGG